MKQYLDLLQKILDEGVEKESGRENMPNTIGISHGVIRMDLQEGFPLLTTKKMYLKGIIHELLWFLKGETNIKYLVDNDVNIWNGDAYRWYLKNAEERGFDPQLKTIEEFIDHIKNGPIEPIEVWDSVYHLGDLGKVYGYQWRNQNGVDQIKEIIEGLKSNPYSRYHILDGWNKSDFNDMALPPCHLLYQFIVRPLSLEERRELWNKKRGNLPILLYWYEPKTEHDVLDEQNIPRYYLDLNMYQRSCDTFLGVPFNIASMSLLLMIISEVSNMIPGVSTWIGGDTHLYVSHLDAVNEQLIREPKKLPTLKINKKLNTLDDILELKYEDFELIDYICHPTIKAELFTGLKK